MIRFMSFLFLWLPLFTTADNTTYTPCELRVDRASRSTLEKIEVRYYIGPTIDNYRSVRVGEVLQLFDLIDNSKPTIFYVFGFSDDPDSQPSKAMINAYLIRGGHNVFIFDWHLISNQLFTYAARSVPGVGYTLAKVLNQLVARGLNTTFIHLVGHSLGAQICGYAGRFANFPVTRITGLDPAGPGFYILMRHVGIGDAIFVVIIHTDRGLFGIDLQTGNADFYPNNGVSNQPGCPIRLVKCSHFRSVYYYIESINSEKSFIGISCDSNFEFEAGSCSSNPTAIMGHRTPTTASGRYYLVTNSDSPYGRGESGTLPQTSLFGIIPI